MAVLYFLTLASKHFTLALPHCKEEEYPVGAECCPKCSPGYRVKKACGEETGTTCVPCLPGTYTAHLNGLGECLHCRVCHSGSEWEDTVCEDCPPGTQSSLSHMDECQPWTKAISQEEELFPGIASPSKFCANRDVETEEALHIGPNATTASVKETEPSGSVS
ncbi:PREDICTED: tumor necrosis factor receptor superfamily member 14 [Chrysochloris asiatica]|uniref:Tumor necrosis factor receptor superfamily member 14 n=1 Tax=Chrysochloris asiatica TaxID=185453 RepID=A0A9B0U003_CHRAS|nr:PREDICTED: tumor necrosis factor receptor superfamily member 14 [Chrysochloris asiatica]